MIYTVQIDDTIQPSEPVSGCGCGWTGTVATVSEIGNCCLTPGDESPAGRCPECCGLVYVQSQEVEVSAIRQTSNGWEVCPEDQATAFGVYIRKPLAFHVRDFPIDAYECGIDPDAARSRAGDDAFVFANGLAAHLGCEVATTLQREG